MKSIKLCALLVAIAVWGAGLGGCRMETMTTTINANRSGKFAVKPGEKVAVLTFTGKKGAGLADLVSIEFLRHGVDVVERNILDRVVAEVRRTEAGYYNADMSDAQIIQQIGRITEADWIVFGDAVAGDPQTIRYLKGDTGRRSPKFLFAYSQLSIRVFSTKTGEVMWWGTTETTTESPKGSVVFIMDHLRMSARRAVDSMMKPSGNTHSKRVTGRDIDKIRKPLVAYETSVPAATQEIVQEPGEVSDVPPPPPPPPPVETETTSPAPTPAPTPAPAPALESKPKSKSKVKVRVIPAGTLGAGCTRDADCTGGLACVNGACAQK